MTEVQRLNPRLTVESVIACLDRAANGGLKSPGRAERVGEHHATERDCRDRLRAVLEHFIDA